jgi:hypothetical protein
MSMEPFDLGELRVLIMDNLTNGVISKSLSGLSEADLERAVVEFGGLTDPIGQLESWLSQQLQSFGNWLVQSFESVINPIVTGINDIASYVYSGIASLTTSVEQALSSFATQINSIIGNIQSTLSTIPSTITSLGSEIGSTLQSLASQLTNYISTGFTTITSTLTSFATSIQSGFSYLGSVVSGLASSIQSGINSLINAFNSIVLPRIENFVSQVSNAFTTFASQVSNFFTGIENDLTSFGNQVVSTFTGLWNDLLGVFGKARQDIVGFFSELGKDFNSFIKTIEGFGSFLQASFGGVITSVLDFFTNLGKGFDAFVKDVEKGFEGLTTFVKNIPTIVSEIPEKAFEAVYKAFLDFLKASGIDKFLTMVIEFFEDVSKFFSNLFSNKALRNIAKYFEVFGTDIEGGFKLFMKYTQDFFSGVFVFVRDLAQGFIGMGQDLVKSFMGITSLSSKFLVDMLNFAMDSIFIPGWVTALPIIATIDLLKYRPTIVIQSGVDPQKVVIPSLAGMFFAIGLASTATFGTIYGLGSAVKHLAKAIGEFKIDLRPLGLGVTQTIKLSELIEPIGDLVEKVGDEIGRGLALSGSLAFLEPLRYVWRYIWWLFFYGIGMGDIPFELPSLHELFDIARRFNLPDNISNIANTMIYRGYPYWFIAKTIAMPSTLTSIDVANQALSDFQKEVKANLITVVDKFGNTRYLPVSPTFEMPTVHDLVEFMLRDLFLPAKAPPTQQPVLAYQSFIKAMWARGVPPDTAYMYYLRAYELPSATQVWDFTMRAISGFAWYVPPAEVQAFAQSEAQIINAFVPQVPAKLNFKYDLALLALAEYQKWHGRAHFAWINDPNTNQSYTSDAWLIIDQSAHLLDRTDIEHLVRHGVWDYFQREYGITNETAMYDVLGKIVEPTPTSPIQIYTDYMSNALIARGFHPYVAPLIAVRDVFDVTTGAKTLLRTGLIDLIRQNIEVIPTALGLMNYFFDVSVHVAYFDMYSKKWVSGWVNAPVRYLEPEAKLLILRSLMDKVNRAMMQAYRVVTAGVRDYLISIKDSLDYMKDYTVNVLDTYYSKYFKLITGREMHLEWDNAFNDAITNYFSIEQTIGTYRRIRYYARYALYRILQLIATGVIPRNRIGDYVNKLTELMRETPQARDVFMYISELEYNRALIRNFETLARVWLTRHALTPDQALQIMTTQGIDPTYAKALVNAYATPYYPTITQLAFLSEYNPAFLGKLPQIIQLMRIPQDWVQLWESYTFIRTYIRWVIRALDAFIPVIATIPLSTKILLPLTQGTTTVTLNDVFKNVLNQLQEFGFDDIKLNFIRELIDFRHVLVEYRNSVPTTWHGLNLSYYVPDPDQFIDSLSPYWVVSQFGLNLVKTLARFRRYGRWMWETVYWAVRAFARGYIGGQQLYQFLQSLQSFGLSKYDIEMIRNFAFAVSCYYGACQYPW